MMRRPPRWRMAHGGDLQQHGQAAGEAPAGQSALSASVWEYQPVENACWPAGQPVPYELLSDTFRSVCACVPVRWCVVSVSRCSPSAFCYSVSCIGVTVNPLPAHLQADRGHDEAASNHLDPGQHLPVADLAEPRGAAPGTLPLHRQAWPALHPAPIQRGRAHHNRPGSKGGHRCVTRDSDSTYHPSCFV